MERLSASEAGILAAPSSTIGRDQKHMLHELEMHVRANSLDWSKVLGEERTNSPSLLDVSVLLLHGSKKYFCFFHRPWMFCGSVPR